MKRTQRVQMMQRSWSSTIVGSEIDHLAAAVLALGVDEAVVGTALVLLARRIVEPALLPALAHVVLLQGALAGLVADRAIERMVDEQEFHHALAQLDDLLARDLGAHLQSRARSACGRRSPSAKPRGPSTSTRQMRQLPATLRSWW
jgi:hypothetical protein